MTRLYLTKTEGGDLIGLDAIDQDYLARMKPGESLECDTRKARHPEHHKKFFALFDQAFEAQNKYPNRKELMIALKLKAGWFDEHVTRDGQLVYVPKSLSWASMDQLEFERFYREAMIALADLSDAEEVVLEADQIIARTGT